MFTNKKNMNRYVPKARAEAEACYPPNSVKSLGGATCRAPRHEPNDETESKRESSLGRARCHLGVRAEGERKTSRRARPRANASHLEASAEPPWGQAEGEGKTNQK